MTTDVLGERGRFAPLVPDHPGVGQVCPGCSVALKAGDRVSLVNGEPVGGERYILTAVIAHESCAYPSQEPNLTPSAAEVKQLLAQIARLRTLAESRKQREVKLGKVQIKEDAIWPSEILAELDYVE